jgi:hypothetical protein
VVTSPSQVPVPARIAARPRDERGYPVPAITPWPDGRSAFAQQGSFRTWICLAERRCTICGLKMSPGPVYRVVADNLCEIELALDTGQHFIHVMPANEGPGHLTCMLYAAVVCPYLAAPGASRQVATKISGERIPPGRPTRHRSRDCRLRQLQVAVGSHGIQIFFGRPTAGRLRPLLEWRATGRRQCRSGENRFRKLGTSRFADPGLTVGGMPRQCSGRRRPYMPS